MSEPPSKERPKKAAQRLYSDQFLAELGQRFGFDALEPEAALELRRIARFYLFHKREANKADALWSDEKGYRALLKATLKFIEVLREAEQDDIAADMYMTARTINPDNDKVGISDLPETQIIGRNDRHYRHLMGLLNLLAASVNKELDFYNLPSGPRKNAALQSLTQSASYFFLVPCIWAVNSASIII